MHENDPLEELLAPPGLTLAEADPPAPLLGRTLAALRWRRRCRKCATAALLAGCYLAGLFTVPALTPPEPACPAPTAARAERLAQPDDAARYRSAGDWCLEDADPEAATHFYGRALDAGESLRLSPADSWLLMAIKQARKKEMDECDR